MGYLYFPRVSDKEILECFVEIAKFKQTNGFNVSLLDSFNIRYDIDSSENHELSALISEQLDIIQRITLRHNHLVVEYERSCGQNKIFSTDQIKIEHQQGNIEFQDIEFLIPTLSKRLKAHPPNFSIKENADKALSDSVALHASTLSRLEQLNEELLKRGNEEVLNQIAKIDSKYDEKCKKLEEDYSRREIQLQEEIDQQKRQLKQKNEDLNLKLKEIDDSNNTHARRQIRDRMLSDVESQFKEFGVSEKTEKKRDPVQKAMLLLIGIFGALLALCLIELPSAYNLQGQQLVATNSQTNTTNKGSAATSDVKNLNSDNMFVSQPIKIYLLWARVSFLSFLLVGSVLYYIKWQNKWAEHHASLEFQLQQFKMDINRANWIIESNLEWQKNTQKEMPSELISSLTKGLFEMDKQQQDRVIHPADELASALLGSASKLKLKIGDNELDFDKPSKIPKDS